MAGSGCWQLNLSPCRLRLCHTSRSGRGRVLHFPRHCAQRQEKAVSAECQQLPALPVFSIWTGAPLRAEALGDFEQSLYCPGTWKRWRFRASGTQGAAMFLSGIYQKWQLLLRGRVYLCRLGKYPALCVSSLFCVYSVHLEWTDVCNIKCSSSQCDPFTLSALIRRIFSIELT